MYGEKGTRRARLRNRTILIASTLAAMAFAIGFSAASITFTSGSNEVAAGTYHSGSALAYWTEAGTGVGNQPASLPSTLSTTVGTPTVLAASGQNYAINTPSAGDIVNFWTFTESTSAPVSTEFVLDFTVITNSGTSEVTNYLETQSTAPGSAQTYVLYYDLGAPTATITLNSVEQISQGCASVGNCP